MADDPRRASSALMAALLLGLLLDHVPSRAADADPRPGRVPLRLEGGAALVDQARAAGQVPRRLVPDVGVVLIYSTDGLEELRLYVDGPGALDEFGPAVNGEEPVDVARWQRDAYTSGDADARATTLERLAGANEAVARQTALAMLESERDEDVLHAAEEPRIADLFRSLASRDTREEIRTLAAGLLSGLRDDVIAAVNSAANGGRR